MVLVDVLERLRLREGRRETVGQRLAGRRADAWRFRRRRSLGPGDLARELRHLVLAYVFQRLRLREPDGGAVGQAQPERRAIARGSGRRSAGGIDRVASRERNVVLAHRSQHVQLRLASASPVGFVRRYPTHQVRPLMRRLLTSLALCLFVCPINAAAQLASRVYATGFAAPVGIVQDPADRTIQYVVEQGGRIRVIRSGVVQTTPFLDISDLVTAGGEDGLLGLAFPPDYATSGRFYVNYTNISTQPNHAGWGDTVVARFNRSTANPLVANRATQLNLLWSTGQRFIGQPAGNHNGGHLVFGPDGFLYIGMGDGGGGNDQFNNAQDMTSLLGKMLRIDVSVPDSNTTGFRIPADNPF